MKREKIKINMTDLANEMADKFKFGIVENEILLEEDQYQSYLNLITNHISRLLPDYYILTKEDLIQLEEDLELYIVKELSNRALSYLGSLDKEDKREMKDIEREYFIYHEDYL